MAESSYDPHRLGRHGEDLAERWYAERGYVVLGRNWRCEHGELDLIVARDGVVVVCEVKTRSSLRFGHPAEAVGTRKQQRLRRLTACWLEESSFRADSVRIDVAAVVGGRVEVIEHAC